MNKVAVVGSGMSAFGAAHRLAGERVETTLYDRSELAGGHTISRTPAAGFIFDIGPHVSFTKDTRIQQVFADAVAGEYEERPYRFSNYWQGHWLGHPAQTNLHGLPPEVIVKVVADFVASAQAPNEIRNYEDWLVASYGRTFADWFPGRYTLKYHTTEARNLTTDWMGPRMYRPKLEEVLYGALSAVSPNVHYIQSYRYPRHGGFGAYTQAWARRFEPLMRHEVVDIDPRAQRITFADGGNADYQALVASIPLPELVRLIRGVPQDVLAAAEQLACSSCVLVNLGLPRDDVGDVQISYFYDLDVVFPRVSYPHVIGPGTVPPGCSSVQVEIYFSKKYRPFTGRAEDWIEPAIRDLVRCGVLRENDEFLVKDAVFIPYANIIFDHDRVAALASVHGFLDDVGVQYCGRYGEWAYFWTDDSFKSGERAAERALASL